MADTAEIRSLIQPPLDRSLRDRMREVFTSAAFDVPPEAGREERCRRAYEQLRIVNSEFGPGTDLLADPARLFELFGWAGMTGPTLPFAMLVHYTLALATVVDQRAESAGISRRETALSDLDSVGCFMITELGRGSSHIALRTEAAYDPRSDEFVLHTPSSASAKLANVGLRSVPKTAVVCARLKVGGRDRGVFAFAVPIRDAEGVRPGIGVTPLPGMPLVPIDSCAVTFDRVRVPRHDWLSADASIDHEGTFGDDGLDPGARTLRTLGGAPLCWTAQCVTLAAAARGCVTIALRHAFDRVTMGRRAPRLRAIAHRNQHRPLLRALAEAYALTFLANHVAGQFERRGSGTAQQIDGAATPWVSVNLTSTVAKALAARGLERIAAVCRQSYGVSGLMSANRVIDYQFLGHAYHSAGGDDQLILLDAARALATSPPPPAAVPAQNLGHVSDPEFLDALFAASEVLAYHQYAEQDGGFDAAMALAEAHGAGLIWRTGGAAVAAGTDQRSTESLQHLRVLIALETVLERSGWLLANKLLSPDQALAIPQALDELCDALLPHALALVDAFDIPEKMLGASISPLV
jgi:acyl-CoA oxidase